MQFILDSLMLTFKSYTSFEKRRLYCFGEEYLHRNTIVVMLIVSKRRGEKRQYV